MSGLLKNSLKSRLVTTGRKTTGTRDLSEPSMRTTGFSKIGWLRGKGMKWWSWRGTWRGKFQRWEIVRRTWECITTYKSVHTTTCCHLYTQRWCGWEHQLGKVARICPDPWYFLMHKKLSHSSSLWLQIPEEHYELGEPFVISHEKKYCYVV